MIKAMLAKKTSDLSGLIQNDDWAAEQKFDGQRFMVQVMDREARAFNRKGDELNMPNHLGAIFDYKGFLGTWVFDGELVDDCYNVFDMLALQSLDLTQKPWKLRKAALEAVTKSEWEHRGFIRCVPSADTTFKKEELLVAVTNQNLEGIVFKHKESKYRSGKSNLWAKYKITDTCDAIVTELCRKGKDQAVTVSLYHEGQLIEVSGVKIPLDMVGKIKLDMILEIRYLYSTANNKLYQPAFLGIREDKIATECTTDQLDR